MLMTVERMQECKKKQQVDEFHDFDLIHDLICPDSVTVSFKTIGQPMNLVKLITITLFY